MNYIFIIKKINWSPMKTELESKAVLFNSSLVFKLGLLPLIDINPSVNAKDEWN